MSKVIHEVTEIDVDQIRIDGGTQVRSQIHEEHVANMVLSMEQGAQFQPVVLFFDGKEYWLADGFHRYHATVKLERPQIAAKVVMGTLRDAKWYAKAANLTNGMPMTREERRTMVIDCLEDTEWSIEKSDREIAEQCGVSHTYVNRLRHEIGQDRKQTTYTTKDGVERTRKVEPKEDKPKSEKPKAEKPAAKPEPVAEVTDKHDEKDETIQYLIAENEKLTDQLAEKTSTDPDFARSVIAELREENNQLKIELKAVKISRDQFQAENHQLKRQVQAMMRAQKKAA